MGVRKNVKFLSTAERENFVRACVLMKADIVNPAAAVADRYSRWDEYVAIHLMIQNGIAPGPINVNFGHGGLGRYSFLSWHRYFLYQFELQLQSYVPGVMLPYWDWTDPASVMTNTFLGPNGTGVSRIVQQGYFAVDRPETGVNTTTLPVWWPASLLGWRLHAAFGLQWAGALQRTLNNIANLPPAADIATTLKRLDYSSFQRTLENGNGLIGNQMHNGMHGWIGGHMSDPVASPFDPFFYLHHCNIDRLWAMWQLDGHATEYPLAGGVAQHNRNDIMYPWTGGAAGYGTSSGIRTAIPMPNYAALGAKRNVDTLDFRTAFGYTYDTIAIIGLGLDRTGSMNGMTPDPMNVAAPDVTKWEAAKRGVSAFLQDCETVQDSGTIYVMAGVKTFTRTGGANSFTPIFGAPGYGLVKTGTGFSKLTFDANIAGVTATGSTPLADALLNVQNTLVEAPFAAVPGDEQRYLAMLTDGIRTSGALMSSIPNGSFTRTAVFGMGFGTGLDVDYATIASMVAKGRTLATQQVFQGENAGTIDKFYSNALARAIGFTTIFDPLIELFEGEHTHLDFQATSAEDSFLITAQGMDFNDDNWAFALHGPGGTVLYGEDDLNHEHKNGCNHCCPTPYITAKRANGRLSLVIQRNNSGKDCWVGKWQLMIAYKARRLDAMVMPDLGEWLFPVSAGPVRGQRYARLLQNPKQRIATRNVFRPTLHGLDGMPVSTNSNDKEACNILVNIYARTNLKLELTTERMIAKTGEELKIVVKTDISTGTIVSAKVFGRLISPNINIANLLPIEKIRAIQQKEGLTRYAKKNDTALLLAQVEKKTYKNDFVKDEAVSLVSHHEGPLHIHRDNTQIPGVYHMGVYLEGLYFPETGKISDQTGGHGGHQDTANLPEGGERFTRLLNVSLAFDDAK